MRGVLMRFRVPSSRAYFRVRVSALDACFAFASPLLALWLRDAPVLSDGSYSLYFYCACSTIFSLISFSVFRLEHRSVRDFAVDDIFDIVKAVIIAELLTAIALFSFTRLDGIPRSTLFIHSLILTAALIAARTAGHLFELEQKKAVCRLPLQTKHVAAHRPPRTGPAAVEAASLSACVVPLVVPRLLSMPCAIRRGTVRV